MRLRPLPLLLAPLILLVALYVLGACTTKGAPGAGDGGAGVATGSVITIHPATTTLPGFAPNSTPPSLSTIQPPTPIPTLASASLSPTGLKYRILQQYPDFFFCDPDFYPVARGDEGDLAIERFSDLQANREEFQAILAHNGLTGQANFTDAQKLLIYRDHKKLAALQLVLAGDHYQFQLTTGGQGKSSFNIQGSIDGAGNITVQQKVPTFATCPICLAAHTLIDTPHGAVPVEELKVGDPVWTVNGSGDRLAATLLRTVRVPVAPGHQMVHIRLADGRQLWASPGHPTADGRRIGDLAQGDTLDGARITLAERVSYYGPATYDLLPSGATGFYWADGILMGSTLKP